MSLVDLPAAAPRAPRPTRIVLPFSLRGWSREDPLDRLETAHRYALAIAVTAVVTAALVVLIAPVCRLIEYRSVWVELAEVVGFALIAAPVITAVRKSSSLVHYLLVFLPLYLFDLYLEDHVRMHGGRALWMYAPGTFIAHIEPPPLRFLFTLSVDAVLVGPLCLWFTRLLAPLIAARDAQAEPAGELPFPGEWTREEVAVPERGSAFWIPRLLGIVYLGYLALLLIGSAGAGSWPASVRMLFEMTGANPILAVDTVAKVTVMIGLTTIAAFNARFRFAAILAAAVGHTVSVASSLAFYLFDPAGTPFRDFLLASAGVDAVIVALFCWVLVSSAKDSILRGALSLPPDFSLPALLWSWGLRLGIVYALAGAVAALAGRLAPATTTGWGALFAFPDPTLGNSLTLHATLALVFFLMSRQRQLRDALGGVVRLALGAAAAFGVVLLALGETSVKLPGGPAVNVQGFLALHLLELSLVIAALAALENLEANVEQTITSFRASSARAIVALHEALFPGDAASDVMQAVDRYAGTIRGRKRGLLNFPFWLVESVFPKLFGLRPAFSTLSREERKYFLRKALVRPEDERRRSFTPELAEIVFQLSVAAESVVLLAAYAGLAQHGSIGYVPPGARDRLQTDPPLSLPPFGRDAPLPADAADPANWRPAPPGTRQLPAPRLAAPLREARLPDQVDYLVIGSGPGGAVAAYRLACGAGRSSIAVLERGPRPLPAQDYSERELDMVARFYKEGGLQQTKRADMFVLQAECVGGGSVINNAVCYRAPQAVRERWESEFGLDLSRLDEAYDQVQAELGIGPLPQSGINRNVRAAFEQAVQALSGRVEPAAVVEVNGPGAVGDGLWNLGNKYYGKRSMLETFVPWAEARGAIFAAGCTAVSLDRGGGHAGSVLVRTLDGDLRKIAVRKAVVVAGGVIASSHFLLRSGVRRPVGSHLSCNFALPVTLDMGRQMDAFDGEQITLGSRDPRGRAMFETYFNPPGAFALLVPFFFDRHREVMQRYRRLVSFGALVGSEPNGVLEARPDALNGRAFSWSLGTQDQENVRAALQTLLELGAAAGAQRAIIPVRPGVELPLDAASIRQFVSALASRTLRIRDLTLSTAHPQGGNRMGSAKCADRVVDEGFRVVGFDNVYVTDASIFPTSLTVNPQWTIMAMSTLASKSILAAHA